MSELAPKVQCLALDAKWKAPLLDFLSALEASGDDRRFKPHDFTETAVERLAGHQGKDIYCVLVEGGRVVGYGMLRGWDEGYEVPSLGIAIHPSMRGKGLGRDLMHRLHEMARGRGAGRVRLRVREDNAEAIALYERLGYAFASREGRYLVGFVDLETQA
jgi:ribosomal-protein-alanine N-acetyltransferase